MRTEETRTNRNEMQADRKRKTITMKLKQIIMTTAASVLLFVACATDRQYHQYQHVNSEGWDKNDTVRFIPDTPLPTDRASQCHIGIRHDDSYPYRDIWLAIGHDTVHVYLADKDGNWIGDGIGQMRQLEVPINLHHATDSITRIDVTHIMEHNPLPGLHNIGLRIEEAY